MATEKFESNEETKLTVEQELLITSLESDDVVGNLSVLKDDPDTTEKLTQLITVYLALKGALGDDAGATVNALDNLNNYQPAKVKKPKEPKAPKFNESKALKDALESDEPDTLYTLAEDERISEGLKNAIITFVTLRDLNSVPDVIVDAAKDTLARFGKKAGSRSASGPKEAFGIEANGIVYNTLISAIRAQGIGKELVQVGEKEHQAEDVAWRKIRVPLLRDGIANYDNVTYTKVAPVVA